MPRTAGISTPKYRKHRATGQAITTICGRDYYLGPHNTKVSKVEYDRIIDEWKAAGRPARWARINDLTIAEMLDRFRVWAEGYYRKCGEPTGEVDNLKYALKPVREKYGNMPAGDFNSLALEATQQHFIRAGVCRNTINARIFRIKRAFRWAASKQLVPVSVVQLLETVNSLAVGRSEARETERVKPVDDETIAATLPHLSAVVRDMVRLQRLTGARPGEICQIRPCDVDTSPIVWRYVVPHHKMAHRGGSRVVFIGPKAQAILAPYLERPANVYCFSPAASCAQHLAARRAARKTPVQPSQLNRSKRKPKCKPGDRYRKDAYNNAIRRACDKARIPRWHANRLRHSAATEIKKRFDLEQARTVLGHTRPDTTIIYTERDLEAAAACMLAIG